jgi:molybdate transport system substrate-binding protein
MEITVIGPAGARASIEELAPAFEAKTGYKIKGTFGASGAMKKRVIDGEAFDVPLLLKPIDDALASGTVVETSLRSLAEVPIALAVKKGAPRPDISTPEALKKTLLEAKSISYPHGAAGALSGVLVDQMLDKMGISDQVLPKVQPRGGTAAVAKGDIDFTLAFQSEINDPGVDIVGVLPASVCPPAPMIGVISSHAKNPAVAKALLEYLSSPVAMAVYKAHGMIPAS